jgi:hypothetical protein
MSRPRQAVQAPELAASSRPQRAHESGDPLVRALAVCVRQAHARRRGRTPLDSMP